MDNVIIADAKNFSRSFRDKQLFDFVEVRNFMIICIQSNQKSLQTISCKKVKNFSRRNNL